MKLVNLYGPGDVRIDDAAKPEPGPKDVLIKVAVCGICGTDLKYVDTGGPVGPKAHPMPLGHELSGIVESVGAAVSGLSVGTRVVVNPLAAGNLIGNGGPDGAFGEYLLIRRASEDACVFPVPDGVSLDAAALTEPLAVSLHAVNRGEAKAGDKAVVLGAGPIGLGAIIALKYRGVQSVVAVDVSETRLALAERLGAGAVFDPRAGDLKSWLMEQHGESRVFGVPAAGTDLFIDAAGVGDVIREVLRCSKSGARLVVVGMHKVAVPVDFAKVLAKELTIRGSMAYPSEFPQAIEMLASGRVNASPMITHELHLGELAAALSIARDPNRSGKVVIHFG